MRRQSRLGFLLGSVALFGASTVLGWASVGGTIRFLNFGSVLTAGAVLALALVFFLGIRRPLVPFVALLLTFPLVDLARKYGSGDPRVVLARDAVLVVGSLALAANALIWPRVLQSSRRWLLPLLVFLGWYVVASVNSLFVDKWLPVVGLRNYFEFIPLLGFGFYFGERPDELRSAARWGIGILCAVTAAGIAQAAIGPGFLRGSTTSDYFTHLDLLRRTTGQTAADVFQPTGVFLEPSRFANWSFVTFAVGLALVPYKGASRWRFAVPVIGALGVFASSGRTLVISIVVLLVAVNAKHLRFEVPRITRGVLAGLLLVVGLGVLVRAAFPTQFESRTQFVVLSLNFTARNTELSTRGPGYVKAAFDAIRRGGVAGVGTGTQGLGRQYISPSVVASTEGGFAVVALEMGFVGFLLWLFWTVRAVSVARAQARRLDAVWQASATTLASALAVQMFVSFWVSVSIIQDFVMNAWFFLVLGVLAGLSGGTGLADTRRGARHAIAVTHIDPPSQPEFASL